MPSPTFRLSLFAFCRFSVWCALLTGGMSAAGAADRPNILWLTSEDNSKTDYNLAGNPKPWDESSAQAHYKNRAPGQPFFAVFNHTSSHESQVAPKGGKRSFRISPEEVKLPPYHPDTPEIRRDWANYYDQMTIMDGQIGALLAELEQAGLADNTIVFYYGDHGGALPRGKRNIHDSGTRVPFIVKFWWRAGRVSLDRVQGIVRDLKLAEPADRIPRFLLSQK